MIVKIYSIFYLQRQASLLYNHPIVKKSTGDIALDNKTFPFLFQTVGATCHAMHDQQESHTDLFRQRVLRKLIMPIIFVSHDEFSDQTTLNRPLS